MTTDFPQTPAGLRQAVDQLSEQVEDLRQSMRQSETGLTEEEHRWVKLAIKREAQSYELRRAIITKTLTGLVWSLVVGLGYVISEYLINHGWKS